MKTKIVFRKPLFRILHTHVHMKGRLTYFMVILIVGSAISPMIINSNTNLLSRFEELFSNTEKNLKNNAQDSGNLTPIKNNLMETTQSQMNVLNSWLSKPVNFAENLQPGTSSLSGTPDQNVQITNDNSTTDNTATQIKLGLDSTTGYLTPVRTYTTLSPVIPYLGTSLPGRSRLMWPNQWVGQLIGKAPNQYVVPSNNNPNDYKFYKGIGHKIDPFTTITLFEGCDNGKNSPAPCPSDTMSFGNAHVVYAHNNPLSPDEIGEVLKSPNLVYYSAMGKDFGASFMYLFKLTGARTTTNNCPMYNFVRLSLNPMDPTDPLNPKWHWTVQSAKDGSTEKSPDSQTNMKCDEISAETALAVYVAHHKQWLNSEIGLYPTIDYPLFSSESFESTINSYNNLQISNTPQPTQPPEIPNQMQDQLESSSTNILKKLVDMIFHATYKELLSPTFWAIIATLAVTLLVAFVFAALAATVVTSLAATSVAAGGVMAGTELTAVGAAASTNVLTIPHAICIFGIVALFFAGIIHWEDNHPVGSNNPISPDSFGQDPLPFTADTVDIDKVTTGEVDYSEFSSDSDGDHIPDYYEIQQGDYVNQFINNIRAQIQEETDPDVKTWREDTLRLWIFDVVPSNCLNSTNHISSDSMSTWMDASSYSYVLDAAGMSITTKQITFLQDYYYKLMPFSLDTDKDGLSDKEELDVYFTNPRLNDTDFDGLTDYNEINTFHTDPVLWDTDGDNLSDGFEVRMIDENWEVTLDPLDPALGSGLENLDHDGDGLTTLEEDYYGSDPFAEDTDGDGLADPVELGIDVDNDGILPYFQLGYKGSLPYKVDSDGDGVSDLDEATNGSPAMDYSTTPGDDDGDGLNYQQEMLYSTSPILDDTDYDLLPDNWEINYSPTLDPLTDDANSDPDNDGLTNLQEFNGGTNPLVENIPPTISITNPLSYEVVSGTVNINVNAADNSGIATYKYYIGENPVPIVSSNNVYSLNTNSLSDGYQSIRVVVYDNNDNHAEKTITVAVDNTNPSLSFTPTGGTLTSSFSVVATASDTFGIQKVEFYLDNVLKSTVYSAVNPYSWSFPFDTSDQGSYTIKVIAYDVHGRTTTKTSTITVDHGAPSLTITNPVNMESYVTSFTAYASASDPDTIAKVDFYVDNVLKYSDTTSLYSWYWDIGSYSDGPHTLKVIAYDHFGATATKSVTVGIDHDTPPTGTITSHYTNEYISGTQTFKVNAYDGSWIQKVEFYWDGVKKATDYTGNPYTWTYYTPNTTDGLHFLMVKVYDNNGDVTTLQLKLNVNNGGGGGGGVF